MNYVVVRTRLQALIASELVANGEIQHPFCLIQTYQSYRGEDDNSVYAAYDELVRRAARAEEQFLEHGTARLFFSYLRWLLWSGLTGGTFYIANINRIPFALALKIVRTCRVRTFDDGSANVQKRLKSFQTDQQNIAARSAWRTIVLRKIFPSGVPSYVRKKIDRHYTIYPGLRNIVPDSKLYTVKLNWRNFLASEATKALPETAQSILLGVVYQSLADACALNVTNFLLEKVDVFLPHPRDIVFRGHERSFNVSAPAESIIEFYASQGEITVYHFNSSAILPFATDPHCKLIDLSGLELSEASPLLLDGTGKERAVN